MQPLGSLFVAGALLLTAGCHGHVREFYPPLPGEATVTVYVVSHGWHTGIVIRRDDIPAEAWPEHRRFLAARFLEVGWGDRAFYESPEAGVRLALKAAFSSEGSVLHVAGFDPPPPTYFSRAEIIAIELSGRGMEALARFVSATYALDGAGQPIEVGPGLHPRAASTSPPAAIRCSTRAIPGWLRPCGPLAVRSRPHWPLQRATCSFRPSGADGR